MHFFQNLNFGEVAWFQMSAAIWLLILLALTFDFLNGLHDAANSVATVVSTMLIGAGSVAVSALPIFPNTLWTSGNCISSLS